GHGMYFIDADGTDPYRPTQIWTQGETEDNRRWFPTWDYPNDKMTFEIAVTVPDSFRTFSNGALAGSEDLPRGLRRDRWVMNDTPMTAYLAAVVAGDFAVVNDEYRREDGTTVPLQYVVEPRFAGEAQAIFGETPEMIGVFEQVFGVPYPWPNYKQVTVRDFTAGGMENTSLTVMYENLQRDAGGRLGNEMDLMDLVSHELAHQWFGDLTTTEDWANITVNEGMATWSEAIYRERAHGMDAAQERRIEDWNAYLGQARRGRRPIVWYGYGAEVGQMFDAHTYQKGGRVFEQLRFELGDAVFFRGLQRFLTEHGGTSVELDDYRQAMEAESGRSLQGFFDQWFRNPGHPALAVEQAYFPGSNLYTVEVAQTQDRTREPLFGFDVLVELNYPDGSRETHREHVASADTTLRFRVAQRPSWVRFDAGDHVPADITLTMPTDELVAMLRNDDELAARYDAVAALATLPEGQQAREALLAALAGDAHPLVRSRAVEALAGYLRSPGVGAALAAAAADEDPNVRAAAVSALATLPEGGPFARESATPALQAALTDPAQKVVARGVTSYARLLPRGAYDAYTSAGLFGLESWGGVVERPLVAALDSLGDVRGLPYLTERVGLNNPDGVRTAAARALGRAGAQHMDRTAEVRATLLPLLDDRLSGVRMAVARGLARWGEAGDVAALDARIAVEDDAEVKAALQEAARRLRAGDERRPARPGTEGTRNG
ncbi:MAG TPA: M1 family aminopeptidase, partial [Rhodothermales bacterium]|nr:M1 family aminopeptidase [Rhodothermales bacterium]